MWHDITTKQFGRSLTVVYAPIRKGECRVFARFPFKFSSQLPSFFIKRTPRWYSHIGQNGVLEDDQLFLHYQERYLEAKVAALSLRKRFICQRVQTFVSALRKWVNEYEADPFPRNHRHAYPRKCCLIATTPHGEVCASCRNALASIR